QAFFFCCPRCLAKFQSNPAEYSGRVAIPIQPVKRGPAISRPENGAYTCPMHPEVVQACHGSCPKCGMALEPVLPPPAVSRTRYTCPMHPQVVRDQPGSCPICGMALEPIVAAATAEKNPELIDMTRRFKVSLALTVPLLILAMSDLIPGQPVQHALSEQAIKYIELILATPVVLWGGWPFLERGWSSIVGRSLNMFTLIAIGTGVAYLYSLIATLAPTIFPQSSGMAG